MIKNLFLIFSLILWHSSIIFSQGRGNNWCGFDEKLKRELNDNPALQKEYQQWRENVRTAVQKMEVEKTAGAVQIIPVVVHVIHDGAKGNISYAQVKDGIQVMNEDFMRENEDTNETRSLFKPYAGVADFEFRLATIDPSGNPTNGIVRKNSQLTYEADDNTKTLSYWNSSKYFNIWLVNSISGSSGTSTILGYAQFPGWGNWNTYGVIMLHTQFGRFGSSSSEGRTASHEVGHCLNLYHTFQGGCGGSNCATNGDDVCDTPPVENSTWGCSFIQNQCSNDAGGASPFTTNVEDQIENYMSYDDCQNMFSNGQIVRMKAAISNNTQLQNLVSTANLNNTGVNSLLGADFYSTTKVVCVNQPVKFIDFSFYGQNGWSWTFNGGTPSSSLSQNPEIIYSTPGLYDVTLNVTDGSSTKTKTVSNCILVASNNGNNLPFSESFEIGSIPNSKWFNANPDNDTNAFQHFTGAGYSGNACIKLDNAGNSAGRLDELIVGSFDFSNRATVTIKFMTAYAQKDTSTKDKLMVYVSSDCGASWAPRYAKVGTSLASAPNQISSFTPADSTQWKSHTATLTSTQLKENVLLKFVFETDEGNNFYLDDINITGTYKTPVLQSPANYSTGQPDSAKVNWLALSGATRYEHQLDTIINFNSPLLVADQHNYISTDPDGIDTEHQYNNLLSEKKYYWRVRAIFGNDTTSWSATWNFTVANTLGEDEFAINKEMFSFVVFPNPLTESSLISLSLQQKAIVSIEVYDITGRKVTSIIQEKRFEKGEQQFTLRKKDFSPGLYLLKFNVEGKTSVQKFIIE